MRFEPHVNNYSADVINGEWPGSNVIIYCDALGKPQLEHVHEVQVERIEKALNSDGAP